MADDNDANVLSEEDEELEAPGEEQIEWEEEPSFDIDYKGDCAYEVQAVIPPSNRAAQAQKMLDEVQGDVEVPGFRKGRAPRKLVEKKFSKIIRGEVDSKLLAAAYDKLTEDNDLHPIGTPDIEGVDELKESEDDRPIEVTFKFEVAPRVELGDYKSVEVERPVYPVDESDAQQTIDSFRERRASFETVEGAEAEEGDQVVIDFEGTVEGEPFQGGSAQRYPYILGTRRFFPEFEEALQGAKAGDELSVQVTLPDTLPDENLRGKQADFAITVQEVKRRQLPEADDEFAKQSGYESMDDMREKLRERLREQTAEQTREITEGRAVQAIIDKSSFEIPKSLVDSIAEEHFQQDVQRLAQNRVPMAEVQEHEEEMRQTAREQALYTIRSLTVLNKIADLEGVEVTEEDLDEEAQNVSRRMGVDADYVASVFSQSDQRSRVTDRLRREKALDVIMDNATFTDVEVSGDEAEEAGAEEEPEEG